MNQLSEKKLWRLRGIEAFAEYLFIIMVEEFRDRYID